MRHAIVCVFACLVSVLCLSGPVNATTLSSDVNPNLCVDWNTTTNGVALWQCSGSYNQNFFGANGLQRYNTMCLDQNGPQPGSPLVMKPCAGTATQNWQIIINSNDPYFGRIRNAVNMCVAINGSAQQGTGLVAVPCQPGNALNEMWAPRVTQAAAPPPLPPPPPVAPPPVAPVPPAVPGAVNRAGFNFNNVPPCPGASAYTTSTDRFTDGTPLPSCGGREQVGNQITTYKLVWMGNVWAKFLPSVQVATLAPPAPQPIAPGQPPIAPVQPPQPGPPAGGDVPLPDLTAQVQLEPMPEIGNVLAEAQSDLNDLQTLVNIMAQDSTGPNPLWDADSVANLRLAVQMMSTAYFGAGDPYSLDKIARGGVVAMNKDDGEETRAMFGALGGYLHQTHEVFAHAMRAALTKTAALPAVSPRQARNPLLMPASGGTSGLRPAHALMPGYGALDWNRLLVPVQYPTPVLGTPSGLSSIRSLSGLERAQRLIVILEFVRGLRNVNNDISRATEFQPLISLSFNAGIAKLKSRGSDVALTNAGWRAAGGDPWAVQFFKKYGIINTRIQLVVATMQAIGAILPSAIDRFYLQLDNQQILDPANSPAHQVAVGALINTSLWVRPTSQGGRVVTPLGVISIASGLGAGPQLVAAMNAAGMKEAVVTRVSAIASRVTTTASQTQVNFFLNELSNPIRVNQSSAIAQWASATQGTFTFSPRPLTGAVEVNDDRVVRMAASDNKILVTDDPRTHRYGIAGAALGASGVTAQFIPTELASQGYNTNQLRAAITVVGTPPPPPFGVSRACTVGREMGYCDINNQCVEQGESKSVVLGKC